MAKIKKTDLQINQEGHLSDLKIGQTCVVLALHNQEAALRRRLLDMGVTVGVSIKVEGFAPLGDPVQVKLRGYSLAMRLYDMSQIDIKRIS